MRPRPTTPTERNECRPLRESRIIEAEVDGNSGAMTRRMMRDEADKPDLLVELRCVETFFNANPP